MSAPELTLFTKTGGPLTKRISLRPDGTLESDGSACLMTQGAARRLPVADANELAVVIGKLRSIRRSGSAACAPICRTRSTSSPRTSSTARRSRSSPGPGRTLSMPTASRDLLCSITIPRACLLRSNRSWPVVADFGGRSPEPSCRLANIAHVSRRSTSAGLFRADTGERLPGSERSSCLCRRGGRLRYRTFSPGSARPLLARRLRLVHGRRRRSTARPVHRRPHGRLARAARVRGRADLHSAT